MRTSHFEPYRCPVAILGTKPEVVAASGVTRTTCSLPPDSRTVA